ncbi:MAG: SGNH/GDSL hydrolase family protein [Rhodobacteraceae bacterium]|nr:SGNH/GDSL hydrolase family protein [Paracoccaceae bacterium]
MPDQKRILCYGDSNTWGHDASSDDRFGPDIRWTGVLRNLLGDGYVVIEEGLGGRTTVNDDPYEPFRNGRTYLAPCLLSQRPLDGVILALGTNDLKNRFNACAQDISRGIQVLIEDIRQYMGDEITVILVAPPTLGTTLDPDDMFGNGLANSKLLGQMYRKRAVDLGVEFFDSGKVISLNHGDGIHLNAENHHAQATALAKICRRVLPLG